MQLSASGRRSTMLQYNCHLEENVFGALERRYPYSIFSFGELNRRIYVRKSRFTASLL